MLPSSVLTSSVLTWAAAGSASVKRTARDNAMEFMPASSAPVVRPQPVHRLHLGELGLVDVRTDVALERSAHSDVFPRTPGATMLRQRGAALVDVDQIVKRRRVGAIGDAHVVVVA